MTEEPEINILKHIQLAVGAKCRLFRNNTGFAWVGTIVAKTSNMITLKDYRPLHAGLHKGSADLIGLTMVEITPDMVGKTVAVFTAIEVKTKKGRRSPDQINFINQVSACGGKAGFATSPEEAKKIIE